MGYVEQLTQGAYFRISVWNRMRDKRMRYIPTYTTTIHTILTESLVSILTVRIWGVPRHQNLISNQ